MESKTTGTDEIKTLAIQYATAKSIVQSLRYAIENPQCGKPGHGFKAAKKNKPNLLRWETMQGEVENQIHAWVGRNRPSLQRRQRRMEMVNEYIPGFFQEA